MNVDYSLRRKRLAERLQAAKLPALAVSHLPNIRYLCGFTGSNGLLLTGAGAPVLFTDPRYELQAEEETDVRVQIVRGPLQDALAAVLKRRKIAACSVEGDHLNYAAYRALYELAAGAFKVKASSGFVESLRAIKEPAEQAAIRRSVELNSKAFARVLKGLKPGVTELDVAAEIEYQFKRLGAEGPAFESIVASGARSALPHARPTTARVEAGRLLLFDMGAMLQGYASDMTRMAHVGKPKPQARRLYEAVLAAQEAALAAVKPGVELAKVDAAARDTLKKFDLDKAFQHSTGHGLGLEIHENPRIGQRAVGRLEAGMAITIEPGAYLEGFGGVRIEDTVLVTERGCEILTPTGKELVVI